MRFQIAFHTPFRVATGRAGEGADATVDRQNPLPASSLKGVMRSAARDVLQVAPDWVDAVYGTAWQPSAWSWSDAAPQTDTPPQVKVRARIQIAPDTGTVAEEPWPSRRRCTRRWRSSPSAGSAGSTRTSSPRTRRS
ncbi:RAMP superfamily CRISPR-associated protein [Phytohabitans flavus]|uniref:RAMP superfamily CRISPR-associated protein n=1 Tax=Phytohabitans flavus TaxID=1076124 RepID=UPI003634BE07